ncbi:Mur ligase family protein [Lysinibacillus sp. MHQ-1]|nr:Mur ligase family protein [Lysinibacillus sp. MHQ-1]
MYLAKNHKPVKKENGSTEKQSNGRQKKILFNQKSNQVEAKKDLPIIAITGSAGKNNNQGICRFDFIKKNGMCLNRRIIGIRQSIQKKHKEEINDSHQAVVLEYGMAYPGIITNHCSIIQPNISIVTNIGLAHVGNFDGDVRGVAKAKSELIHGMDQQGLLILNKDDDNSRYLETQQFKGKMLTVGIKSDADYRAYDLQYKDIGMSFKMKLHGQEIELYIPILGEHHVYNALNAVAVADYLGFSPLDIQAGLNFKKATKTINDL